MKVSVDEFLCLKQLTELWRPGQRIAEAVKTICRDAKQKDVELDEKDIKDYVLARAIGNVLSLVDVEDYDDFTITDPVDDWHLKYLLHMRYIALDEFQTYQTKRDAMENEHGKI